MRFFLMIILVVVIMLVAVSVTKQYKDKFDFYSNLKMFLIEFKINLAFKQENIKEILKKTKTNSSFFLFIGEYQNYLENGQLDLRKITFLDQEEIDLLEDIIKNIGKYNVKNEIAQMESFLLLVEEKLNKSSKDKQTLCPMITKLSFLFALGLVVILI